MELELHQNNCARKAQVGVWIFKGPAAMMCLVIGFGVFILSMQCLNAAQVDFPLAIAISATPLFLLTLFVKFFINDKPESYAFDMLFLGVWRLKTRFHKIGLINPAPQLWPMPEKPEHPKNF